MSAGPRLEQIKASAGSGKTYTLTQRFMALLCGMQSAPARLLCRRALDYPPSTRVFSEIMAITFTNKAASEMKTRVVETLKQVALWNGHGKAPDAAAFFSPGQAQAWLDDIFKHYDSLNIRTIDSLLNLLVRISAVSLKIPPDFELVFDDRDYLTPLYEEFLDRARGGDALAAGLLEESARYLLYHTKFTGVSSREGIRSRMLDALSMLAVLDAEPCADRELVLARQAAILADMDNDAEKLLDLIRAKNVTVHSGLIKALGKCRLYLSSRDIKKSAYFSKAHIQECVTAKNTGAVDDELNSVYAALCRKLDRQRSSVLLYQSALGLMPFVRAAGIILPELERLQRESGAVSSSRLTAYARNLLNAEYGVSEACCRMGSMLSHLLVDEFQDTSREQWYALEPLAVECLSRGGSLRYVGDVKQAIYSWRGGDSSLFSEIASSPALTAIVGDTEPTRLEFNWRSAPEVVGHNNRFFSVLAEPAIAASTVAALLPQQCPAHLAAEGVSMLRRAFEDTAQKIPSSRSQDSSGAPQGFVSIRREVAEDREEYDLNVMRYLDEVLLEDVLARRSPGEVAVLVRKKDEAELVASWLLNNGVAVVTEHSFKLDANPLIRRLLAFMAWLDYPADDLSFWDFVSGEECFIPVSGLDAATLENWIAGVRRDSRDMHAPLFRLFGRDFPDEWAIWLEPFYSQSGLMSAYDTASEAVRRFSLLSVPGQQAYIRRFLELVHAAESRGHISLTAFLDFWKKEGAEQIIPSPELPDAVRIMTIHKAKGLEFPVVVMPFHRFTEPQSGGLTLHKLDGLTLLVQDMAELGDGHYRAKLVPALEKLNLLYVGWTRAGEELHAYTGCTRRDLDQPGLPRALDQLLSRLPFEKSLSDGAEVYEAGTRTRSAGKSLPDGEAEPFARPDERTAPGAQDADEEWQPMEWLPLLKIFRNPVPELVYDQRVRGILLHHCLENLHVPPGGGDPGPYIERGFENAVRNLHLPVDNLDEARAEVRSALEWFCTRPGVAGWLAGGSREQSIMDEDGSLYRVDLLVDEGARGLLVVDYKSGEERSEYLDKMRHYMRLLAGATGRPVRGVLAYLDLRRFDEVPG